MRSLKILYILPAFQHPQVRGPNRHYHFIRELSRRHRITLLALQRSEIPESALQEVEALTERLFTFQPNGISKVSRALARVPGLGASLTNKLELRDGIGQMKRAFQKLLREQKFDVVLFHGKSVFDVIADGCDLPIVADFCDATSMRIRSTMRYVALPKRAVLALRYLRFRKIEKELLRQARAVAFISNRDRQAVNGTVKDSRIVPIGVDFEYWKRRSPNYDPECIVYTGVMDYGPNHDAAMYLLDRILPLVKRRVPQVKLFIVGRNPRPELETCANALPEVTVTGFVADMRPYLESAAVMAAPLRYASGIQNKVLEAMSMGVPVVTSSVVGDGLRLDDRAEPPLSLADDPETFADKVVELMQNPEERSRLSRESRAFVERHFDWSNSAHIIEELCLNAVAQVT